VEPVESTINNPADHIEAPIRAGGLHVLQTLNDRNTSGLLMAQLGTDNEQ
jgi:hypothetical protein